MLRVLTILLFIVISTFRIDAQSDDKVLMTVGDLPVTVGEFKYIYEKNNGEKADYSKESVEEYLELYKKFKLKVALAKDEKLDTISSLRDELQGYRSQLAKSFLIEKEVRDYILNELYHRKKEDVEVAHIFINKPKRLTEKLKKELTEKTNNILKELNKGMKWDEAVVKYSEDEYTKENNGSLGYLTAKLPNGFYDLENLIYSTNKGKIGDRIAETDMGYHIIKVNNKRPAKGTVKVAQIFIKSDSKGSIENTNNKKLAKEAYEKLKGGASWDEMVKQYSSDEKAKKNGGKLPEFGIGIYSKDFEEAAFNLSKAGDVTKPIETRLGFHILKLIEKPTLGTRDDYIEANKESIKKSNRYKQGEKYMLERFQRNANMEIYENAINAYAKTLTPKFYNYIWKPDYTVKDVTIMKLGNQKYYLHDFIKSIERNTRLRSRLGSRHPIDDGIQKLLEDYKKEKTYEYAEANLESKYPSFKALMREYNEGVLLFEITKRNVWDKASEDTDGLNKYFNDHKADYQWKDRATLQEYTVSTNKHHNHDHGHDIKPADVYKYAANHSPEEVLKKFNDESHQFVQVTESKVEKGNEKLAKLKFEKWATTPLTKDSRRGSTKFSVITDTENARPKTLEEAKGYAIADYQEVLEKEWVKMLMDEYRIKVKKKVLKSLIK